MRVSGSVGVEMSQYGLGPMQGQAQDKYIVQGRRSTLTDYKG